MTIVYEDALQRRIARFLAEPNTNVALNSYLGLCAGSALGLSRKDNQDRCLAVTASYSYAPERNFTLGVVCDGIGGMQNGAECATLALSIFASQIIRTTTVPSQTRLSHALEQANDAVHDKFGGRGGTTLAALLVTDDVIAHCINAGDSRAYGIRSDDSMSQLTRDDTLGAYQKNENLQPNPYHNRLIQFVGMGEDFQPQVEAISREEFGRILLTSDGVHSAPRAAFEEIVRRARSPHELANRLLTLSELLGGKDNATVVYVTTETTHRGSDDHGLTLIFVSPSDRLELWIPKPSYDNKQENFPEALNEASDTSARWNKNQRDLSKDRRRPKNRRKSVTTASQKNLAFDKKDGQVDRDGHSPEKSENPPLDIRISRDDGE